MTEPVANLVQKITGKKPTTEEVAKKYLSEFLKENNMPSLDLELKDLLEISVHYTDLNPQVSLNNTIMSQFDEVGKLRVQVKTYINAKKDEKHLQLLDSIQNHVIPFFKSEPDFRIMKVTNGVSFLYQGNTFLRWCELYYFKEDKILGTIFFPATGPLKKSAVEVFSQYSYYKINRETITGHYLISDVLSLAFEIFEKLKENEKRS